MSLTTLYADRMEAGLQRDLARPPQPVAKSFDAWAFATAASPTMIPGTMVPTALIGGAGSGLSEIGASAAEFLSGAQSESIRAGRPGVLQDQPDDAARRSADMKLLLSGGVAMRHRAESFVPPESAHEADKVLHGLGRIGAKAVAASALPGGPLVAGTAVGIEETNTRYRELVDKKGVDPNTALKVAGAMGAGAGLGLAIPMAGPTIKSTIALATASGPGLFMAQEKIAQKILENAAYHDEASLHDPTDPLGLTIATLFSAGFGGARVAQLAKPSLAKVVEHLESRGKRYGKDGALLTSPKGAEGEMQVMPMTATDPGFGVKPAQDDSPDELARVGRDYIAAMEKRYGGDPAKALAAYNAGPGRLDAAVAKHGDDWLANMPAETRGYVAHGLNKLNKDGLAHAATDPAVVEAARVRVTEDALNRSLPGHLEARQEVMAAHDLIAAGRMPRVDELSIEQRFELKLRDYEAAKAEYATREDAEGGKVMNTDTARELSPDYLADRTRSADVHEPASAFIKRLYAEKLADMPEGGSVLFTSGGTGAGKTSAIRGLPTMQALKDDAHIVFDTNMNTLGSAVKKIEQALEAGAGQVNIVHVMRDPVEALVKGALTRAMSQEKKYGSGRTVPLAEHAKTHRGSAEVIQQLAERYKDDPRVSVSILDNTRGRGAQRVADMDFVRSFDYTGLEGKLHEATESQHAAGAISEAVYRGTTGHAGEGSRAPVRGNDGAEPALQHDSRLPDSGRLAADEVAAPKPADTAAGPTPASERVTRLAETPASAIVALRKRVSILNSILECIA
jgi:hypothetical protein